MQRKVFRLKNLQVANFAEGIANSQVSAGETTFFWFLAPFYQSSTFLFWRKDLGVSVGKVLCFPHFKSKQLSTPLGAPSLGSHSPGNDVRINILSVEDLPSLYVHMYVFPAFLKHSWQINLCIKCNKVYHVPSPYFNCSPYFSNCCSPREEQIDTDSNSGPPVIPPDPEQLL